VRGVAGVCGGDYGADQSCSLRVEEYFLLWQIISAPMVLETRNPGSE
jgi:hypothetical protein